MERAIEGVSRRMLTLTLRGQERNGLITHTVYQEIPPRAEYASSALA
jgi:DNA-binding HxlR family transcriptional regulator